MRFGFSSFVCGGTDYLRWLLPPGCRGLIDLTSPAAFAELQLIDGARGGVIFCALDDGAVDEAFVAFTSENPADAQATGSMLDAWESVTGFRPSGDKLADLVFSHLTAGADPSGDAACLPLMPAQNLSMPVWLAGQQFAGRRFDMASDPHAEKVMAIVRAQLDVARELSLDGKMVNPVSKQIDDTYHRRVADKAVEQFAGSDPKKKAELLAVLCPDWSKAETLLPHNTTISENFTGTDDVLGNQLSWTEVDGDWDRVSDKAQLITTATSLRHARADSDLSGANHYAQCTVTTLTNTASNGAVLIGPSCRFASGAESAFSTFISKGTPNGTAHTMGLRRVTTGTEVTLGTDTGITITGGHLVYIEANGSSIVTKLDGATVHSQTDTNLPSNLRGGLNGFITGTAGGTKVAEVDDWSAGDLAAGSAVPSIFAPGHSKSQSGVISFGGGMQIL